MNHTDYLKEKYDGKLLTTDEAAAAHTEINQAIEGLEAIKYTTGPDNLLLKWGTLKGWDLHSDKALALLKEYGSLGASLSVMTQHDTPRQKEIVCELIDECDGIIQNDWDGNYYTKQQAKDYVMGYDVKPAPTPNKEDA